MAQLKARITQNGEQFGYELVDPVGNIHAINPEPLTTFPRAQAAAARLLSCTLTPMSQEDIKMKQVHAPKGKAKAAADAPAAPAVKKSVTKKAVASKPAKKVAKKTTKKKAVKK